MNCSVGDRTRTCDIALRSVNYAYAGCRIRTDMDLVEVVRAMLTGYSIEMSFTEQQSRRSTDFIIEILSRG